MDFCDGWIPRGRNFDDPDAQMARLARYADEAGREMSTISTHLFGAKDRATAAELAGPYLLGKYRDYAKRGQDDAMPNDESFDKDFEELTKDRFVLGSPEECYEQLQPYWQEIGVNHLIFRTQWAGMPLDTALGSMRLMSEELIPELSKLRSG